MSETTETAKILLACALKDANRAGSSPTPDLLHVRREYQDYTIYPGHEERLTREEWWQRVVELANATSEPEGLTAPSISFRIADDDEGCVAQMPDATFPAISRPWGQREAPHGEGADLIEALKVMGEHPALADDVELQRKPPFEMSAEECKTELDEAGTWATRKWHDGRTHGVLIIDNEIIFDQKWWIEDILYSAAVSALREHEEANSDA